MVGSAGIQLLRTISISEEFTVALAQRTAELVELRLSELYAIVLKILGFEKDLSDKTYVRSHVKISLIYLKTRIAIKFSLKNFLIYF